jgi:hypothetical protein
MQALRNIQIDFEIHKMIEAERTGFDEPEYLALRRLLKLPPPTEGKVREDHIRDEGAPWMDSGVIIPHGTPARMEYARGSQVYEGKFLNGKLVVNGKSFTNLSAAATALAVTRDGKKPSLNGWVYWQVKMPGSTDWVHLIEIRNKTLPQR